MGIPSTVTVATFPPATIIRLAAGVDANCLLDSGTSFRELHSVMWGLSKMVLYYNEWSVMDGSFLDLVDTTVCAPKLILASDDHIEKDILCGQIRAAYSTPSQLKCKVNFFLPVVQENGNSDRKTAAKQFLQPYKLVAKALLLLFIPLLLLALAFVRDL